MTSVEDEINKLAERSLADCRAEMQTAHDALIRANAFLDKHHELTALARRMQGLAFIGVDHAAAPDFTSYSIMDQNGKCVQYE